MLLGCFSPQAESKFYANVPFLQIPFLRVRHSPSGPRPPYR